MSTDRMAELIDLLRSMTYRELTDFATGVGGDVDNIIGWAEVEAEKILTKK